MSDYKIRVDVASDYSLAVEAAKINGNLDDLKLKVSSVKKVNGKNIITFSDGSQAVINDGATPTINDDGYWIINGQSTGVKGRAEHNFNELTDEQKLSIKGDKGDPLTWPDLTPSQREALRGERGFTGPAAKVTDTSYDSSGNTVITFNDGTKATIKKGDKGDKGNTGNSVSVSSVTKSGLTNTVKFSDGKTMKVKDGESVTVSSSRFLDSGDTEVSFSDGKKAVIKKGVDGTVDWNNLTEAQRKSLIVPVVDDLTSGGTDKALSAEQGKEINTALADLANKVAAIKPGYGVGDFIQLGNLKAVVEGELLPVEDWDFTGHTGSVNSVAVDGQGNVYSGSSDKKVMKISPSGTKIWELTGHTGSVNSIAVDDKGNVYSGGSDEKVMKISPNGSKVWEFTEDVGTVSSVAVDSQDNVYSGGSDKKVMKISPNGSKVWGKTTTNMVRDIAIDNNSNILIGCVREILKLDKDGTIINKTTSVADVRAIAVNGANSAWATENDYPNNTILKLDTNLNKILKLNMDKSPYAIAVDGQGNVYSGGSDEKVTKISSTGSKIWDFTGRIGWIKSVAVDDKGNVYSGGSDEKIMKIKQEGDTKIVGYEVIK
nr:MAG TPA: hypothetical protein [Caudoviricetes sp.]